MDKVNYYPGQDATVEAYATTRIAREVCEAMRARIEELERLNALLQREIDQAQETLRGFQLPPHALKGLP
jgi:DNA-directed RNA polymerase specialized sigma subunit